MQNLSRRVYLAAEIQKVGSLESIVNFMDLGILKFNSPLDGIIWLSKKFTGTSRPVIELLIAHIPGLLPELILKSTNDCVTVWSDADIASISLFLDSCTRTKTFYIPNG